MRFALAVALLWSPLVSPPASADQPASLLAKHRAYVGWQLGDGTIRSLSLVREYADKGGYLQEIASEIRTGLRYRRDDTGGDQAGGATGFTGRLFWQTSRNGFTVPLIGDNARELLAADALFNEAFAGLPAVLTGSTTIDGTAVSIVRVTMTGAFPVDIYIDPQTGAYLRAVIDPGGASETRYDIHAYLDLAGGKKCIGSWSVSGTPGTYRYIDAKIIPRVSDDALEPPAPSATWTFADSQPFTLGVTPKRFYVEAIVNGVPGRFILDTGDDGISLTDDFADRAHVKAIGVSYASVVGGVISEQLRRADTIAIGGNTLSNVVVKTFADPYARRSTTNALTSDAGDPDGMLGLDFLAGAVVTLDPSLQTMRIQAPSTTALNNAPGFPVQVNLAGGIPTVEMTVDNKARIDATLDTGEDFFVILSYDIGRAGVDMNIPDSDSFGDTYGHITLRGAGGGEEQVACSHVDSLSLGPIVTHDVAACESYSFHGRQALVGYDFLQHFKYIFDYPDSTIIMTPLK